MDKPSQDRINALHPKIKDIVTTAITEANLALSGNAQVRISQGLRTFREQNNLYAQGRTAPGKKVTNAKGGQSIHNYGLAVDIVLIIDGKTASWDTKKDWDKDMQSDWMEVVHIFKKHGFDWGGDWKTFTDMPHFEMPFGLTWRALLSKYNKKDYIADTNYLNI